MSNLVDFPLEWERTTLGDVVAIEMGQSPDGSATNTIGDGLPLIGGASDLGATLPRPSRYTSSPTKVSALGDLILCVRATIGKLNYADGHYCLGRGVAGLSPIGFERDWLKYYLTYCAQDLDQAGTGSTFRQIDKATLQNWPLPLPPLNEQRRIVTKIEALIARSQRAKEALEAIPLLLNQFRQSVLTAAFRGDLSADWREKNPDVEPASVLLERIGAERRYRWEEVELEKMKVKGEIPQNDKWKAKYQEPLSINQEHFSNLPENWHWAIVEELVSDIPRSIQSGPFGSNLLHSEFQDTGVLAIGIDNVLDGHFTLGREHRISYEKYKELEKYTARPSDVLITVMATVGRCCVVPLDIERAIITKHVYRLSPKRELIAPHFLMNALRGSEEVLRQMYGKIRGQTRPGINGQLLRSLAIPVPPRLEQEQILSAINTQFASVERVFAMLNELGDAASLLDQSILTKAFRGELVPQDPNDEPASVLLERIRAERAKREVEAKGTKKSTGKTTGRRGRKAKQQDSDSIQLGLPGVE